MFVFPVGALRKVTAGGASATYRAAADGGNTDGAYPDGTGYSDGACAISALAGDLLIVFAHATLNADDVPTCTDNQSGTYTRIYCKKLFFDQDRMSCFVRTALCASTATHTVTVAAGAQTSIEVGVLAIKDMYRAGSSAIRSSGFQEDQAPNTTPAPALNQAALTANVTIVAVAAPTSPAADPPTGWTERIAAFQSSQSAVLSVSTRDSGFTGTTITFDGDTTSYFVSMALELDGSPV